MVLVLARSPAPILCIWAWSHKQILVSLQFYNHNSVKYTVTGSGLRWTALEASSVDSVSHQALLCSGNTLWMHKKKEKKKNSKENRKKTQKGEKGRLNWSQPLTNTVTAGNGLLNNWHPLSCLEPSDVTFMAGLIEIRPCLLCVSLSVLTQYSIVKNKPLSAHCV